MHHRTFCTCSPRSVCTASSFSVAFRCTLIFQVCLLDVGLYAVDLSVRLYARFACSKVTALTREVGGLVRIDFDNSKLPGLQNYVCGQFVRVCFPTLNSFEWHPFTICGSRCKGSSTILISPAVQGREECVSMTGPTLCAEKRASACLSLSMEHLELVLASSQMTWM